MYVFTERWTTGIHGGAEMKFNDELILADRKNGGSPPVDHFPALISVHPYLLNDFKKFERAYLWAPDPQALERAKLAFEKIFFFDQSCLSYEQAVSEIELSASPGFPWNIRYTTKRECLLAQGPLLKSIVDKIFTDGEVDFEFLGVRYTRCYWLTSPKSEIRSIDKLNNDDFTKRKVRTFMCADIVTHIVSYMLYKVQNDRFHSLADAKCHWSKVGLNPWYGGWDRFTRTLIAGNAERRFTSKDASHMEASVSDAIQEIIYNRRDHNRSAASRKAADWFFSQISCSYVINVDGYTCVKFGKNPSGSFCTLSDNTLALIFVFLYAIAKCVNTWEEVEQSYYDIPGAMVGDDSLVAEHEYLADIDNAAAELGFELTDEAPPSTISKCRFLNSAFFFDDSRMMWFQQPNFNKLWASVFYNFKAKSWRMAYVKLCAVRKLCFAFPEQRTRCDVLLEWIHQHKFNALQGETKMDDVLTFKATMAQRMPDSENEFLLTGNEMLGRVLSGERVQKGVWKKNDMNKSKNCSYQEHEGFRAPRVIKDPRNKLRLEPLPYDLDELIEFL